MPQSQQLDVTELRNLAIGYDTTSSDLSPEPRLVSGSADTYVTGFSKLGARPGTGQLGSFSTSALPGPIDHYILYETLDNPPRIWVVMSVKSTATGLYEVWVMRLDGDGTPHQLTSVRGNNASVYPHEFAVSRGLCYFKCFSATDVLGSLVFNGSTQSLTPTNWGLLGPTVAARVQAAAGWSNSTFVVTVNFGWYYCYTWKTNSGQESTRSPLETNPSQLSSNSGPISGTTKTCPQIVVQGNADTQVTSIVIYRTTDGGGTFYPIDTVTNTGAGNITYNDKNFADGNATPSQPVPDTALNTALIAPSLTSNTPPPTVIASSATLSTLNGSITNSATSITLNTTFNGATLVNQTPGVPFVCQIDNEYVYVTALNTSTGVATVGRAANGSQALAHASGASVKLTPITGLDIPARSTPIAVYAGRLWYAIGNILFYSGQEEISVGVPEECWPAGQFGNFYRLNLPIVNVYATSEALYVLCTDEVYWLRGTTRDTFQLVKLFGDIGAKRGHPRAVAAADKSIIWLTHDQRIAIARGYKREILSDKINRDIRTAIVTDGSTIHLVRYAELEKDWLVVLAVNSDTTKCKQFVYDFNSGESGLWNAPWTIPATAACAGQPFDTSDLSRKLTWAVTQGNAANALSFTDITVSTASAASDYRPGTLANVYSPLFTVGLVRTPTGNHINALRLPSFTSVLHAVKIEFSAHTANGSVPNPTSFIFPSLRYSLDDSTYTYGTTTGQGGTIQNTDAVAPPRREQSTGFYTLFYHINQKCDRVAATFTLPTGVVFEFHAIAFIFNPDAGC